MISFLRNRLSPFIILFGFSAASFAMERPVVLITGATSGIGLSTAGYLAAQGFHVYGTYRSSSNTFGLDQMIAKYNGRLEKILLDVTDAAGVNQAVTSILQDKSIDVVINNAAYAMTGTVESCSLPEQKKLFDTNFFGAVNIIQAVLPHFRKVGKGKIINIGSVVDIVPFPAIEIYSASKFALAGLTESMAVSLAPLNIKVSLIEPDSVRTPAAINQLIGSKDLGKINPYRKFHEIGDEMCKKDLASGSDPIEVAKLIYSVILEEKPKLRYPFGEFAKKLAESRFKDPSGGSSVKLQIEQLTECGLLSSLK